jgi:hypothetical protein
MHDSTVSRDGSAHDSTVVVKVDDEYVVDLVDLFADTKQE